MARIFFAVGVATLVVAALPAAAARRDEAPYPCDSCLFEIRLDGTGFRIVAQGLAVDDLSPDRRSLLFDHPGGEDPGLYIARIDGKGRREISPDGTGAAFSPDGRQVVFVRSEQRGSECARRSIWVVGADGKGLRQLAPCASSPAWAPDSRRIAYFGSLVGTGAGDVVVASPAGPKHVVDRVEDASPPVWSPRGDLLAYSALADPATPNAIGGSGGGRSQDAPYELRVIRADGRRVASYPSAGGVAWSPDGRTLAFDEDARPFTDVPFSLGDFFDYFLRIAAVPGPAGPPHRASAGPWSPDGRLLAFAEESEVLVLPRTHGRGGRRVTLLQPGGSVERLWWSRDGKRLLLLWKLTPPDED